jgi:iron complex transport system permease protein
VFRLSLAVVGVAILAAISLLIGAYSLSFSAVLHGEQGQDAMVFITSRIPRTVALILAGASMSVAGLIMQLLARNKFVEPSTAGTVESASLGLLVVTMLAPATPMIGKMLVASVFALADLLRLPSRPPAVAQFLDHW